MATSSGELAPGLLTLKRLAVKPAPVERCGICDVALGPQHRHLVEPTSRRIECACLACALLFENQTGRYRLVPRDPILLDRFALEDAQWGALDLPIDLAFFFANSVSGKTVGFYPSPAGATESLLPLDAWQEIVQHNPRLGRMQPDVEALLVNRLRGANAYFIAPIDCCYELVGLVRKYWRGFSGGDEVWEKLDSFFASLRKAAIVESPNA